MISGPESLRGGSGHSSQRSSKSWGFALGVLGGGGLVNGEEQFEAGFFLFLCLSSHSFACSFIYLNLFSH